MKPEKLKKIVSLWSLALLMSCPGMLLAQTAKEKEKSATPQSSMTVSESNQPASAKAKSTQPQSSDPVVNSLQKHITEQQAVLERGIANKSLTQEQIAAINADIAATESKVKTLTTGQAPTRYNKKGQMVITRADFMNYPSNKQTEVSSSLKYEITDLVNATPATLSSRMAGVFYLTVEQFNTSPSERKLQILQNPSQYIIVNNASEIPKITISRAELNSLPATKQQSILNSGEFKVVD